MPQSSTLRLGLNEIQRLLKLRLTKNSIFAVFFSVAGVTAAIAQEKSGNRSALIDVQVSDPRYQPNTGFPTFALRIKSLTGQPVRIAAPIYSQGWSAYTSTGVTCNRFSGPLPPVKDGQLLVPSELRAGVNAPVIVPIRIGCNGINRGSIISISLVLLVEQNGNWIPKQIAIEEKQVL